MGESFKRSRVRSFVYRRKAAQLLKPRCIIIPAYNEGHTIGEVVARCRQLDEFSIIVVDDHSTDDTRRQAEKHGAIALTLPVRLGAWGATQTGLRLAARSNCSLAVTLDGDGQHDPKEIHHIVQPVLADEADIVIGSCPERGSVARRVAWAFFRHLTTLHVLDITSGFRALNRRAISLLASERATLLDYQDLGVLLLARQEGLRILEVPVAMRRRRHGASRVFRHWGVVCWYLLYSSILGLSKRTYVSFGQVDSRAPTA